MQNLSRGLLVLLWGLAPLLVAQAKGVSARDDSGNRVTLPGPAMRIISLAPSVTEIVYAAGAGKRLVGVSAYSRWPVEVRRLPRVGDAFRIDLERIVALRPDLVVAWASATPPAAREALKRLGLPLFLLAPRRLNDIAREIRAIGRLAGTSRTADRAARGFERTKARLAERYSKRRAVTVFYEISTHPLYTVGGRQMISRVIRFCGGRNIFAGLGRLAPVVEQAAVLARNPQVILTGSGPRARGRLNAWKREPWLVAVKAGSLFIVPAGLLGKPAPRILLGAQVVCRALAAARQRLYGAS